MKYFTIIILILISGISFGQAETDSIWSALSQDDVYEFTYSHSGCFSVESRTITIKKDGEQLVAKLSGNGNNEILESIDNKDIVLQSVDLDRINNYLLEISSKKSQIGFCTSTSTYSVKLNGVVQTVYTDSSCSEPNLFSKIIQEL